MDRQPPRRRELLTVGLAEELGYQHSPGGRTHRAIRWLAGTRAGAWTLAHTLRHADAVVGRLTRGSHSAPSIFTGLAVLTLTTTGRRSGVERTTHLIATPHGHALGLLGTNFGQQETPAWARNLESHPRATVTYRGVTREVLARPATPAEAEAIFANAATFYVGYRNYRRRVGDSRQIRVFMLESSPGPNDAQNA